MFKMIDVSKHQGHIDWDKVMAAGITNVILRLGYGNDVAAQDDTLFHEYAEACTSRGIKFGAYIYSYAKTEADALSEANHALRVLKGYELDFPVYYDLEDEKTTGTCSNEMIERIAATFAQTVQAAGYMVGIYANKYWWTTKLTGSIYEQWERWVAQYNSECTYSGNYGMWQYGSDGRIDGVSAAGPVPVDVNICYKDYPEIIRGMVQNEAAPAPTEQLPDLSAYSGVSIAAALKECGYDNSYTYRAALAERLGIFSYQGTAEQNLELLQKLGATVVLNDKLKVGAAVRIRQGAIDLNTNGTYAAYVYKNTYTVLSVRNGAVTFGVGKTATGKVDKDNVILA